MKTPFDRRRVEDEKNGLAVEFHCKRRFTSIYFSLEKSVGTAKLSIVKADKVKKVIKVVSCTNDIIHEK